jgi:CRISPR-associated endonuclease/helicase Cas3
LIQRAGRLCRHRRDVLGDVLTDSSADQRGALELIVYGPQRIQEPTNANWLKQFSPGSAAIYEHHGRMWLTAKILGDWLDLRSTPRGPIEAVYASDEFPVALEKQATKAEGGEISASNSGAMNKAKIFEGFQRKGDWSSEERIPTRLGDESVELVLARVVNGEIVPYSPEGSDEYIQWSLSIVRMLRKNADRRADLEDRALESQAKHIETQPRFKYQVLCVLDSQTNEVVLKNGVNATPISYCYSPLRGFIKKSAT